VVNAYINLEILDLYIRDDADNGDAGDLYWYFKVDGATVINRPESDELKVSDRRDVGSARLPSTEYTLRKSPSSGQQFTISGRISDNDGGLRDGDDHSNVDARIYQYPWRDSGTLVELLSITGSPSGGLRGVLNVND
jgi:hypothetical protein